MAHATYIFLLGNVDLDQTDEELFEEINSAFDTEYGHDSCDENNWYTVYGAITKDGRLLGKSEFVDGWAKEPTDRRFEEGLRYAAICVATEMELYGVPKYGLPGMKAKNEDKLEKMSRADIIEAIYAEVPRTLAEAYENFKRTSDAPDSFDSEGYQRESLARQFEKFNYGPCKPFAAYGTPYEYRCFDLRHHKRAEIEDTAVLVLVDIHT